MLEIGAAYGYSTVVLAQTAQLVVSIDPHEQMGSLLEFKRNITEYGIKDRVLMSIGDSKQVLPQLIGTNMRFNLVFIDGDHHYEAVKADIANAKHLLCPSGVIACHDYHEDTCPEVAPAIDELLPNGKLVADTLWVCRSFPS